MANFLRLSTVVAVSVAALLWVGVSAQNLEGVLSTKDQKRMESLLSSAQIDSDLTAAYQVVAGLSALSGKPSDSVLSKACNTAKSKASKDSLESLHQAAYIASIAGASCKLSVTGSEAALKGVLVDGATSQDLYFAISALTNLKFAIDDKKAVALLKAAVDNDDGALSYGMAFLGASLLKTKEDLKPLLESVEDVIGQADSTETTLYYSDGLSTTSAITVGMFSLMTAMNQDASLKSADVVKLSNYFLSSRYAASVSDSYSVVTAAAQLAKNKFYVPTVVVSEMKGPVTQANQNLKVRLTNIMDAGLGKADVTADVEDSTGKSVVKDKALSTADNVIYSMEMFTAVGSKPGTYTVKVKTTFDSKSPAFSISQAVVMVSVAQKLTVTSAQLAIIDRDQDSSTAAGKALTYPGTSKESFSADSHQKVVLKFKLSTESPVHQSFVRMTRNGDDIFFIAEQDKSKAYVFEMDVNKVGKESFNFESGNYEISLLIGDVTMETPLQWNIGSIKLTFSGVPAPRPDHSSTYKPNKEIKHMFREPEKRPPAVVSMAFSGLLLLPLAVMLIAWLAMGVNIFNVFGSGIWGMGFHVGLAAIFGLYFCFWTNLNMFQTLKYLAIIGIPTFVAGHKLLHSIAKNRVAA